MEYKKELAELIDTVIKEGASDLHLAVGRSPIIRVSGFLIPLIKRPAISAGEMEGVLTELLTPENKQRFLDTKEIDFSYTHDNIVRFRGNGFFLKGKVAIALRLIPKAIRTLAELNLPPLLEAFTKKPQGFFLVVGPVGQGKTTTLADLIEMINTERLEHIITI